MPSPFGITAATNTIHLDEKQQGQTSFTVFNMTGKPIRGRARVVPQTAATGPWLTLLGEAERDFASSGTQQYAVQITAPSSAPAGDYTFRLDLVDVADPDDNFSAGPTVSFALAPPPPAKKPCPWWIVAVVVGVLILLGGGAYGLSQVLHKTSTPPPELTAPVPIAPANGTTFTEFLLRPITVMFVWSPVPHAVSYNVQIENCSAGTNPIVLQTTSVTGTSYTLTFTSPPTVCWQIWAVDANGHPGPKSPMVIFFSRLERLILPTPPVRLISPTP